MFGSERQKNSNTLICKSILKKENGFMIIDAHAHLGHDFVFEEDFILENLISKIKENKVDISIVQPGTVLDLKGVPKQHNAIAKLSMKMPRKNLEWQIPVHIFQQKTTIKNLKGALETWGLSELSFIRLLMQLILRELLEKRF